MRGLPRCSFCIWAPLRCEKAAIISSARYDTACRLEAFGIGVDRRAAFVAGSQSVAEERQYGTLDGLLCLPVSRRAQFGIKLAFVLVLGGLLSASLLCGAEEIASAMGAGTGSTVGDTFRFFGQIVFAFLALSLLGFYASTLTRSVQRKIAGAVCFIIGGAWLRLAV